MMTCVVLSMARKKSDGKAYLIHKGKDDAETMRNIAKVTLAPSTAATRIVNAIEGRLFGENLDIVAAVDVLKAAEKSIHGGDLRGPESMLIDQATALQSLFVRLVEWGWSQSQATHVDTMLRLALRAQNQCRMTLETLSNIKNPPVVYARQANVTTGPQQVNNGVPTGVRDIENRQTQLSELPTHELLSNTRASCAASQTDSTMATVGALDRAEDASG